MAAVMCFEKAYCFTMQSLTRAHSRKRAALVTTTLIFRISHLVANESFASVQGMLLELQGSWHLFWQNQDKLNNLERTRQAPLNYSGIIQSEGRIRSILLTLGKSYG